MVEKKPKLRRHSLQAKRLYERERERALSGAPVDALIRRVITQEEQAKESKRLLRDAVARLEASERRAMKAEKERRGLEVAQAMQGLKVTQNVMDVQEELARVREDVGLYKVQLEFAEIEMYVFLFFPGKRMI